MISTVRSTAFAFFLVLLGLYCVSRLVVFVDSYAPFFSQISAAIFLPLGITSLAYLYLTTREWQIREFGNQIAYSLLITLIFLALVGLLLFVRFFIQPL